MNKKPPLDLNLGKYALDTGECWYGYDSAYSARMYASASVRLGNPEPPIWRRTPDGWTQLKPGRPKPSGTRGYGGGNPELRLRAPQAEIDGWRKRAAKEGLELQDWVRRVLRGAQ